MKTQHIERIPVAQIRIVNPRSRNQFAFRAIINNIKAVGLKKLLSPSVRASPTVMELDTIWSVDKGGWKR